MSVSLRSKFLKKFAKRNVEKIAPKMDKKNTNYKGFVSARTAVQRQQEGSMLHVNTFSFWNRAIQVTFCRNLPAEKWILLWTLKEYWRKYKANFTQSFASLNIFLKILIQLLSLFDRFMTEEQLDGRVVLKYALCHPYFLEHWGFCTRLDLSRQPGL